jgi:hemolysin activation/secretion protein
VVPVLRPGKSPGTTDIDLNVEDKPPLSGNVEVNNQYSPNTTHSRLSGTLHYDNLWQREHGLSLQFQTTPENTSETKAISASYVAPLERGDALAAYAVRSDSNVAALGSTSVLGRGNIFGLRYVHPLAANGGVSQGLTFGLDYKDFKENVTSDGSPGVQTPIRYLPFSLNYNLGHDDEDGRWDISTGLGMSFRGIGSRESEFQNKRYDAHANYMVWKWDVARSQSLGKQLGLYVRFDGQLADQSLVSNEQFVAGGAGSVRGYLQSEGLGDDGSHLSLELRGPAFRDDDWSVELRPHAFVDGAWLKTISPLPGQKHRVNLASAGFGLSVKAMNRLALSLNLGWPMRDTTYSPAWQPRLQFSSSLEF